MSNSATSLKGLFQELGKGVKATVILGTVISEVPLKIKLSNDDKIVVGPDNVYIPRHLTNYETKVDIEIPEEIDSLTEIVEAHSHPLKTFNIFKGKMTVYNALKVGETVHLLAFNNNKQYYILDRTGGNG